MATGNEQAKFSVVLDDQVSDPADEAARAVEALRERMASGERSVKEMSAALRRLKGSSEEVTKAKEQLKAKINAEKDSLSASQLAMLKMADTTKKATEKTKELAKQKGVAKEKSESLKHSTKNLGGELDKLKEQTGEGSAAMEKLAGVLSGAILGAIAAAGAAIVGLAYGLARFITLGANAARSTNLMREAFGGSAANGAALGSQIDLLARKVPTAKKELDALAGSLLKSGLEGQTFVDALNAISQANAALGDDAGGKLRELLERGKITKRFSIQGLGNGFDELQGTGIQRDDVAAELAKSLKVSISEARAALAEGRVKLGDGAAAMRAAIEKKFGGLNLRKMLDLNVMSEKLKERFDSLTNKVDIEPLLRGFAKLGEIFDENTVTGASLKQLVTIMGDGFAKAVEASAPVVKKFIQGLIIGALQAGIAFLQLRNYLRRTFGDSEVLKNIDLLQTALLTGKVVVTAFALGVGALVAAVVLGVQGVYAFGEAVAGIGTRVWDAFKAFSDFQSQILNLDWLGLGKSVIDGLISGLTAGVDKLGSAVKQIAEKVKGGFKDALQIHSPSKVFAGYGRNTVEGYQEGIESKTPDAAKALDAMAEKPAAGASTKAGGGANVVVHMPVEISVPAGEDVAKTLTDPSFLQQLTKALEDVLINAGVPVNA